VAEDQALPSKLWERAAAGERPEGVSVIPQGNGWMARGPYASVLVGLAVLDGYLRLPSDVRANLTTHGPLLLPLLLVGVPVSWVLWKRRGLAANRGVALLVTPADLLLRTSAGVMRVAWSSIARVEVATMRRWSLLRGAYEDRALVLHRKHVEDIHYSEAFLAVPAEVVAGLCDAQRKSAAAAAPESTPAS
jgi:hypothetical protein